MPLSDDTKLGFNIGGGASFNPQSSTIDSFISAGISGEFSRVSAAIGANFFNPGAGGNPTASLTPNVSIPLGDGLLNLGAYIPLQGSEGPTYSAGYEGNNGWNFDLNIRSNQGGIEGGVLVNFPKF